MPAVNTLDLAKAAIEQALAGLPSIDRTLRVVLETVSETDAVTKAFSQDVRILQSDIVHIGSQN